MSKRFTESLFDVALAGLSKGITLTTMLIILELLLLWAFKLIHAIYGVLH